MSNVSKTIWVAIMVFIAAANMVGSTMTRRVERESGKSYWPPAANTKLARDYRALYGPDRNYFAYCFFHIAFGLGILVWAFYTVLTQ